MVAVADQTWQAASSLTRLWLGTPRSHPQGPPRLCSAGTRSPAFYTPPLPSSPLRFPSAKSQTRSHRVLVYSTASSLCRSNWLLLGLPFDPYSWISRTLNGPGGSDPLFSINPPSHFLPTYFVVSDFCPESSSSRQPHASQRERTGPHGSWLVPPCFYFQCFTRAIHAFRILFSG